MLLITISTYTKRAFTSTLLILQWGYFNAMWNRWRWRGIDEEVFSNWFVDSYAYRVRGRVGVPPEFECGKYAVVIVGKYFPKE